MNTSDIIAEMTKTSSHINEIQSRFYEVVKIRPSFGNYKAPKGMYGVFNKKTKESLSDKSMGKNFVPMQQQELLNNILATVHEFQADLNLDTLQFNTYCGGSKIEFTIETKPLKFKNAKSVMDETNIMLSFTTSYDGSKSNRYALFTKRVVCENGMTVKEFQGELKGRNTQGGKTKILSYAKEIAEIINGADKFKEKMIALDKIKISRSQVSAFTKSLLGFNAETLAEKIETLEEQGKTEAQIEQAVKLQQSMLENLETAIALEFNRTGETAFGLLQGVTYYTNHIANETKHIANKGEISNDEYIRFYQGAKTNDKAQDLIFALLD